VERIQEMSMQRISPDDAMKALRKVWMQRGQVGTQGGLRNPHRQPEPPRQEMSPAQVRIGWYIPSRHAADTLATYRPQTYSQSLALQAVREWVDGAVRGEGPSLALVGPVGTGKSHLLYAAVREVNERSVHAAA